MINSIQDIHSRLKGVKQVGEDKWMALCPAHDDHNPSLSLSLAKDGRVLIKCFAGCASEDVCQAIGLELRDLNISESASSPVRRAAEICYDYCDEAGKLLFQVVRRQPKKFFQRRPDGNGGWINNLNETRRVLYRLPELLAATLEQIVFIVEGEKDADRLVSLGLIATANPHGAGKWWSDYNEVFRDRKVVILPDNDKPGQKHAELVAQSLQDVASELRIVNLPGLPEKGDISDWLDGGGSVDQLLELVKQSYNLKSVEQKVGLEENDVTILANIPYRETPDGLIWQKPKREGTIDVSLANFTAKILEEILLDDGLESQRFFELEVSKRNFVKRVRVRASEFKNMDWIMDTMGAGAYIYSGQSIHDHTRLAIQMLSGDPPVRQIYQHIGWRKIGDQWGYLNGEGAISSEGLAAGVEVNLPNGFEMYRLSEFSEGEDLKDAVRKSLELLELGPDRVVFPLYAALWRSVLGSCDFALHLSGKTGAFKTQLLVLIMQHFGSAFRAENLPGSWSSTANALEMQAFTAKDAIFPVDDFAPGVTMKDMQELYRKAERLIRAQGNNSGRSRLRSDSILRAARPPRGLILSTGEDNPRGQSLLARMILVELEKGDIQSVDLTRCQRNGEAGIYARAMTGYLQWLASRYEQVRQTLRSKVVTLRDADADRGLHGRTPENIAHLRVGFDTFMMFALESGAVDSVQVDKLQQRCQKALDEISVAQGGYQQSTDPVDRFFELITSATSSGRCFLASVDGEVPAESPTALGWRRKSFGNGLSAYEDWQPQGVKIGWVDGNNIYLDPNSSYEVVQAVTGSGDEGITISARTLRKRIRERGLCIVETGSDTNLVRRKLEGKSRRVLNVQMKTFFPSETDITVNSVKQEINQADFSGNIDIPVPDPDSLSPEDRELYQTWVDNYIRQGFESSIAEKTAWIRITHE